MIQKKKSVFGCVYFFFLNLFLLFICLFEGVESASLYICMYVCVCVWRQRKRTTLEPDFGDQPSQRRAFPAVRQEKVKASEEEERESRNARKGKEKKKTRERERDERDKAHASTLKLGSRKAAQPRVFSFLFHLVRRN